jgi:hypothetical protein
MLFLVAYIFVASHAVAKPLVQVFQRGLGAIEQLPPDSEREVVGIWQLLDFPAPMTRVIEKANDKYYMIARWISRDGQRFGGEGGIRLEKLTQRVYRGVLVPETVRTISDDGSLLVTNGGEVLVRGKRTADRWPK